MATKKAEKMGRPTKLTQPIHDLIVKYIKSANYVETAAAAAGINKSTLYDWLKRGSAEKSGIYADFSNAVEKALAESEIADLKRIEQQSRESWQAAAWRLERRFPDRWGRKDKITADITQTEKEEIIFEQKLTADPEARELLRQLFRKQMELERAGGR
jgi:type IV secretory pathway TrbF-like protein